MNKKEDDQRESGPEQVHHTKKRSTLNQSHETRSKERGHGKIRVVEKEKANDIFTNTKGNSCKLHPQKLII